MSACSRCSRTPNSPARSCGPLTDDPGFHVAAPLRMAALASYARPADSFAMARAMADFLGLLPGSPR